MGRPLNKRFFGSGAGDQIKVRAKIGSNAEGDGFIVSQRGSKKFKVNVGGTIGDCFLVDKANGSLAANEMTITVQTDAGTAVRATKISAHRVSTAPGTSFAWTFDGSISDGRVEMPEVETGVSPFITIGTQPSNATVTAPATGTFTVIATVTQGATLTYQWQIQQSGAGDWSNISGATSASYTTGPTAVEAGAGATNGDRFRVIVSATSATSVTSNAATLTVNA
jgi:hypothetical protein